jgi:O-antigen/teichoic acid export membrane protein
MTSLMATLRWGGAYVVITRVAPTVSAFFVWQGAVSIITTAVLIHRTYSILPSAARTGRFERAALQEVYDFARGMFLGSLLAFVLTQSDKLAVSTLLPLGDLGYYTLAATVASALMQLVVPLNTAVYPRLTGHVADNSEARVRETYHAACEWMAAIVVPPALVLAFFPELVLLAWSGNHATAGHVAPLLRVLVLGQLANAFMNMPYMLQLAYGWTALSIRINSAAVLFFVPAVLWAVPRFGAIGAAWVWLALNLGYLAVVASLMHRRLLLGAMPRWYRGAVAYPLAAGGAAAFFLLLAIPHSLTRAAAAVAVLGAGAVIFLATGMAIPAAREWALTLISRRT